MNEVIIRLAHNSEITRINELFIQMIKHVNEKNEKRGIGVDNNLFKDGYEEGYLENFFVDMSRFILVADLNGQVIGYLSCIAYPNNDESSYLYLDDFCIDSNYRGKGIGSRLVENAIEFANLNNLFNLKLHVDTNNKNAVNFYTKLGFMELKDENRRIEMILKIKNKSIKK